MKIAVFGKPEQHIVAAFTRGCEALGYSPVLRNPAGIAGQPECGFDFICANGLHGNNEEIVNLYAAQGVPAVVLDLGYTHRPDYFQMGWQGINKIPEKPCSNDRAFNLFGILPTEAKPRGDAILVCCQKHGDKQHGLPSVRRWADAVISEIQRVTDRPIRFRPHPLYRFMPNFDVPVSDPERELLETALAGAYCMVTHNSTAALQALLSGIPVFCDSQAIYAEIANTDLAEIERPKFGGMDNFFNRLAYGQWTLEEMASGKALEFLLTTKHEATNAVCN